MNGNGAAAQYINQPPSFPDFIAKYFAAHVMMKLIKWALREYRDRMNYLTDHAYWRQRQWMAKHDTPQGILSRHPKFLKWCAYLNTTNYSELGSRDRQFIRKAFDLTIHATYRAL